MLITNFNFYEKVQNFIKFLLYDFLVFLSGHFHTVFQKFASIFINGHLKDVNSDFFHQEILMTILPIFQNGA